MTLSISNMPPNSRVWVHQSTRELIQSEVISIQTAGNAFVTEWAAHGASLKASFDVLYNRFLIVSVDENEANATGCSIDSSVKFIKEIAAKFDLDFFDRMNVAYRIDDNTVKSCDLPDFKQMFEDKLLNNETIVFNNMVTNKKAFDTEWEIPLKSSWQANFLS